MKSVQNNRRILICDDEAAVREAYQRILGDLVDCGSESKGTALDVLTAELFGEGPEGAVSTAPGPLADIQYCCQGEEAVTAFAEAKRQGEAFAVVFLDVRMPPGIDGVEAARQIRALDPTVNIVIVTGYSDHRPSQIADAVGLSDRLFYLVKPFNGDEVRQLVTTLANRWTTDLVVANELATRLQELQLLNHALKASEASAYQAARSDPLTGLLNRRGFEEQFAGLSAQSSRSGTPIGLLYLDLDRFKRVNDTHGHHVGDLLICEVAGKISEAVGDDGFAARLGGDEFAVACTHPERLDGVLSRLLKINGLPFAAGARQLPISLSIGHTSFASNETTLQEAMRRADIALYAAKAAGRGIAREFSHEMDCAFLSSERLAEDLRQAIRDNALVLHYQPLMSADGTSVTGVEALLRWNHPEQGPILPEVFVALAEQSDIIVELGDWVLRQAFTDAQQWPDFVTSINLSAAQFVRKDFAEGVLELARALHVLPSMVEFEITETTLSADLATFAGQVRKLKQAGFRFALDDFGSGYASLGYLSKLEFNKLKIDRSFVRDLTDKPNAESVIRSIVGLGEAMGLTVTAEGVEEEFQHALLRSAGCNQMQGYLFHKPGPKDVVKRILSEQRQRERAA